MTIWVIESNKIGSDTWIAIDVCPSPESARHYLLTMKEPNDFERDGSRWQYRISEYVRKEESNDK